MTRHALARLGLCALLLSACGTSHSRSDDAGGASDGGTAVDGSVAGRDSGSGRDAGPVGRDASVGDGGLPADAGTPGACDPQRASAATCPNLLCDGPSSWHWNGDDCVEVECGACVGEDCATAWFSRAECMSAHAECTPALCRTSGGEWRFWGEDCGHYACGYPPPASCLIGVPVCDCGPMQVFDEVEGCRFDVSCTMGPPIRDPEAACTETGGTWGDFCCDSVCGERCGDACTAPACDCGVGRIFDATRGCVSSATCYEGRGVGETCLAQGRCDMGLICCERCGGAGCVGPARCQAPVCDDDPDVDQCGNNLLAP